MPVSRAMNTALSQGFPDKSQGSTHCTWEIASGLDSVHERSNKWIVVFYGCSMDVLWFTPSFAPMTIFFLQFTSERKASWCRHAGFTFWEWWCSSGRLFISTGAMSFSATSGKIKQVRWSMFLHHCLWLSVLRNKLSNFLCFFPLPALIHWSVCQLSDLT